MTDRPRDESDVNPWGIDGARDAALKAAESSGGGGAHAGPAPTSAPLQVTVVLVDGTRIDAGSDSHAGLAQLRAALDARTLPYDMRSDSDSPHPHRTLMVGEGKPEGYIVPAGMVSHVEWKPVSGEPPTLVERSGQR